MIRDESRRGRHMISDESADCREPRRRQEAAAEPLKDCARPHRATSADVSACTFNPMTQLPTRAAQVW